MCGRVTLSVVSYEKLCEQLGVDARPEDAALYKPRWNVAPTDPHWIERVTHDDAPKKILEPATWGLINFWAKDAKRAASQINARAEGIATSRAFKEAYAERRCVVPIDGWYEWSGPPKDRRPHWFHRADSGLILLAGLYEDWRDPKKEGAKRRTFTVLTTDAKGLAATYHDRMPVRIPQKALDGWLTGEIPVEKILEGPMDDESILARDVDKRVNSVKNDDPSLLAPTGPEHTPPPKQRTLF